jgi:hypothetical protein
MVLIFAVGCSKKQTALAPPGFAPLQSDEYLALTSTAKVAFSYATDSGNFSKPSIDSSLINLNDFIAYADDASYDGIRIYPGFDLQQKRIIMILCKAKQNSAEETDYIALLQNYTDPGSVYNDIITKDAAGIYLKNYLYSINLFSYRQYPADTAIADIIKYSRFYHKDELTDYLNDNIPEESPPYNDYKMNLEIGYISYELALLFKERFTRDTFLVNEVQGVTNIMCIVDPQNERLIDRAANYKPTPPTDPHNHNYYRLYLEVGVPCPPKCGSLYIDKIVIGN